jgi:hypothetical protein
LLQDPSHPLPILFGEPQLIDVGCRTLLIREELGPDPAVDLGTAAVAVDEAGSRRVLRWYEIAGR